MPLILWILLIAFILTIIFSWGMGGFKDTEKAGVVGTVGGQEITYDAFENAVQQQISSYTQRTGSEPQEQTIRDLRNQAWDQIVREILFNKEAERLGIKVTDAEIVDLVNNNPPEFIQNLEYFQTEGQFDIGKYQSFLHDPRNRDQVIYLEDSYRKSMLERKLLSRVSAAIKVTVTELKLKFEEKNTMGKAKFLFFAADSMKLDSSAVTDKMIDEYYYSHMQDYLVPEKRRMLYVQFMDETSAEDSAQVLSLGDEIRTRLDQGEDFSFLAVMYSDHHTAADSGKLGWVPHNQVEAAADSALWVTPVGKYFGPLVTRFGVNFYKALARKMMDGQMKTETQIIQLKFMPSADTKDIIANKAAAFAEDIKENDFVTTAESYKIKVDTSGYFQREGAFVPGLGRVFSEVEWAFSNPAGANSEVYPLRNGWMVFKILDIAEEHYTPLAEVKESIYAKVMKEKKQEAAYETCQKFYDGILNKKEWMLEAGKQGLTVLETEHEFRFGDFVKNVGRDFTFTSALFRAKPGELYGPVKGLEGSFILELTEVMPMDSVEFDKGKFEHLPELMQGKQEVVYERWLNDLKDKYKVEDFRFKYYRKM